jgi:hypothetical protein
MPTLPAPFPDAPERFSVRSPSRGEARPPTSEPAHARDVSREPSQAVTDLAGMAPGVERLALELDGHDAREPTEVLLELLRAWSAAVARLSR